MGRRGVAAMAIALAACGRVNFDSGVPLVCGPAYQPAEGLTSKYRVATGASSWFGAQADCELDGGHLVVIDSAAENSFVTAQLPNMDSWIGLTDHVDEGTFVWVTGKPVAFDRFSTGEPNDSGGNEDCIEVRTDGSWNDKGCRTSLAYVCECDLEPLPEPATYCDTDTEESCGECGVECTAGCANQVCGGGGGG